MGHGRAGGVGAGVAGREGLVRDLHRRAREHAKRWTARNLIFPLLFSSAPLAGLPSLDDLEPCARLARQDAPSVVTELLCGAAHES